jgi:hypothetical protein
MLKPDRNNMTNILIVDFFQPIFFWMDSLFSKGILNTKIKLPHMFCTVGTGGGSERWRGSDRGGKEE